MNKTVEMGNVGVNVEEVKAFVSSNKDRLENEAISLPGELGDKGVKVIRTDKIDTKGRGTPITSFDVDDIRYTVFY